VDGEKTVVSYQYSVDRKLSADIRSGWGKLDSSLRWSHQIEGSSKTGPFYVRKSGLIEGDKKER
jgi:hypothetical protein